MIIKNPTSLFLALVFLAGCTVGPDYHRPNATAPAQWGEPMAGGETNGSAANPAAWWKDFNDVELDSLIERAVSSNLDLKIASARVREARAAYQVTSADFWPTVNTSASYERLRESKNQPIIGAFNLPSNVPFENNVYQAGFDSTWELDVFGGTRRATEAARAEVAAAEYGRRDTLVTLLAEVARNYAEARGYQRRLEIARQNIDAQKQSLAITQNRFTNGVVPDLDVQQASTLLSTTRAEIPTLEIDLHTAIHRLGVLLGQPPEALMEELSAVSPIPIAPVEVPVGLPSELLLRRPDVQKAERQLAAATAEIGVATADLFPKFSLTGAAGFQSVSAGDWFAGASKFWSVGPTVQWRIFDAGRIRANIKVQNARQEEALANYEKTVLGSFEDVENALVRYAREQVRRRSLEEAVKSSQESLRVANQLYANGLVNFINVLDAERSMYQTEDELVQSERAVSANLISLYKALGGGWEAETKLAEGRNQ
ncbi:MAG TPA: efflux transporter outer membrane subunit [Verrucomicrobiae bacterium]|jgi:NodT family efflux transporter outer membrane factor (OMF) lipoprotein|nr:efflux transporter outer membrane subunit [Verrucomicrobiae bacterium]